MALAPPAAQPRPPAAPGAAGARPSRVPTALLRRAPDAAFALLLVLHVLPVWLLARFPTQDGPTHVENVVQLLRWDRVDLLRAYLVPNWGLQPNWLAQALFAGLNALTSTVIAERLVLTGILVLLPLAARFALPPTRRGRWASLAAFPFLYGFAFHMGFWNFTYGLVLVLAVAGAWRRMRQRVTWQGSVALATLLALAYACHPTAVSASLVVLATTLAWRGLVTWRRARRHAAFRRRVVAACCVRAGALALAAAPSAVLLARFMAAHRGNNSSREALLTLAGKLVSLYALVSVDRLEILVSIPIAMALLALVVRRLLRRRAAGTRSVAGDGWLAAAVVFAALYFAVPDVAASGSQISDRLALLPYLMLVLWMGSAPGATREVRRVALAVALLSTIGLAVRAPRWYELSREIEEYASMADHVAPGSAILPLTFAPHGLGAGGGRLAWRVRPLQHAAGYVAAARDALDLDDAQANTDYSPLRFAAGAPNPFLVLGLDPGLEGDPPCVDLARWRAAGGAAPDVLVFAPSEAARSACGRAVLAALGADHDLVAVSRPAGLVHLYHPRPRRGGQGHTVSR